MELQINANDNKLFKWNPSMDSVVAIGTLLGMWISFYIMYHTESLLIKVLVFGLFGNIVCCVGIPVIYTLLFRKEKIASMGITTKNIIPVLVISFGLAFGDFQELIPLIHGNKWLPQLIFNILIFWEPFFIFGWLQSRFRKDYGIIPGIILAGISLGIYHIGSFPADSIFEYFITGIVFSSIYSVIQNIFVMWPIFWCIGATIGTIKGKMEFDWTFVFFNLAIFLIQASILFFCINKQKKIARDNNQYE